MNFQGKKVIALMFSIKLVLYSHTFISSQLQQATAYTLLIKIFFYYVNRRITRVFIAEQFLENTHFKSKYQHLYFKAM